MVGKGMLDGAASTPLPSELPYTHDTIAPGTLPTIWLYWEVSHALPMAADLQELITQLKHKHAEVRYKAALALGDLGDPRAIAPLMHALRDRNQNVRYNASWALTLLGTPALPYLLQALQDKDPRVRQLIPFALAELHDWRGLDPCNHCVTGQ
jgi:HEAT repeat protein